MAGPGKGLLKRFGPQKSSSSCDVPQIRKSSSICDIPQISKSSSIRNVPQPPNSSSSRDVPRPHKSSSSRDVPRPHKSSSSHDVPQPQSHVLRKRQAYFRLQDEEFPIHETVQSVMPLPEENYEEDHGINSLQTESDASDTQEGENIGSTSHGTSVTRKESRALSETRKRRLDKGKFIFEVDECAGRIIGEDGQRFITKGGCVMREYAKFDGTTWKKQDDLLKADIITKCTENSSYDPTCRLMVRAMQTQLANQHKNRQYRLHLFYKNFPTKEEAARHPPNGISDTDWIKLCDRFSSEEFQKISTKYKKNRSMNEVPPAVGTVSIARIVDMRRREGKEVSAIDQYKIGHFSKKKNKMVNEKADEIWNELQSEEATSTCTPAEICLKKLRCIPGHIRGRSASTKQLLATENLRMELELEKRRANALEEEVRAMKKSNSQFEENIKDQIGFMMEEITRLSGLQSQKN